MIRVETIMDGKARYKLNVLYVQGLKTIFIVGGIFYILMGIFYLLVLGERVFDYIQAISYIMLGIAWLTGISIPSSLIKSYDKKIEKGVINPHYVITFDENGILVNHEKKLWTNKVKCIESTEIFFVRFSKHDLVVFNKNDFVEGNVEAFRDLMKKKVGKRFKKRYMNRVESQND